MAMAVNFGYRRDRTKTAILMLVTAVLGATFVGMQAFEWTKLITEGVRPWGNPWGAAQFGSTFFMITGFHGTHVTIGVIFLLIVARKVWRGDFERRSAASSPAARAITRSSRSRASTGTSSIWSGCSSSRSSICGEGHGTWQRHQRPRMPATATHEGQQHPIRLYLVVWGWLFVLSACSYLVDYFHVQGYLRWYADPAVHDAEGGADRRRLHAYGLGAAGAGLRDPAAAGAACWSSWRMMVLESDYTMSPACCSSGPGAEMSTVAYWIGTLLVIAGVVYSAGQVLWRGPLSGGRRLAVDGPRTGRAACAHRHSRR